MSSEAKNTVSAWFYFLTLLFAIQAGLLWFDRHPMFFLGDSASYIWTAISGSPPSDRSFVYGYFIHLIAVTTGSLTSLVLAQVLLHIAACAMLAHLLIRYFRVHPWLAFAAALLASVEPLQLLYTRYVMTETLALFVFVFYVGVVLRYLEDPRVKWLCFIQGLALLLISIRFAFIPLTWICAFVIPMMALPALAEKARKTYGPTIGRMIFHVVISAFLLLAFSFAYQHLHGYFRHKPPAYSYDGGFFALGYVVPLLEPGDFKDKALGEQVLKDLHFPASDRRARPAQRWMEGGVISRLQKLEPDRIKADAIARQAVLHVVIHKPIAFLKLGWQTFTDYFNPSYLQESLKIDLGHFRLDRGFHHLLQARFDYMSDQSSALDMKSLTGRYFLQAGHWIKLLLLMPLGWLILLLSARSADSRSKILVIGLISLMFAGVAVFLVERPTPRYLHANAWLFFLMATVGLQRLVSYGQSKFSVPEINAFSHDRRAKESDLRSLYNRCMEKLPRHNLWFWGVMALLLLSILWIKHVWLFEPTGPACFNDEFLYKRNAANFFEGIRIKNAHYPPLYSLVIVPAFLFPNWYDVIIRINGLLSTLLAIPAWLLARTFLGPRPSAFVVILSLMIPFQVIYPGIILSENLFMLIFAFAVWLALKGVAAGQWQSAAFGLTLALACLTRYLMLPAIFILLAFWLAAPYLTQNGTSDPPRLGTVFRHVIIMAICFALAYTPWLIYTRWLEIPLLMSLGFGISGLKAPQRHLDDAILWISVYASYIVLAAAPFILPMLMKLTASASTLFRCRSLSREAVFGWLVLLLTICYWLLAANHSFSASYNAGQPTYLIGRYLMFLTPLYILAGVMSLRSLVGGKILLKPWQMAAGVAVTLFVIAVARWILHGQGIWALPDWFANIEFNAPDSFSYKSRITLSAALACAIVVGGILWVKRRNDQLRLFPAACAVLFVWHAAIFVSAANRLPVNLNGLHARNLAPALSLHAASPQGPLDFYYDVPAIPESIMNRALIFWGTTIGEEKLHILQQTGATTPPAYPLLLLARHQMAPPALLSYKVGKDQFYLYRVDEKKKSLGK